MSELYRRFRPENSTPGQFLRPSTEPLSAAYAQVAFALEGSINAAAARVAKENGLSNSIRSVEPRYQVGGELEVVLFSSLSDPIEDRDKKGAFNPNYSPAHIESVEAFGTLLKKPSKQGGLRDVLYRHPVAHVGRISTELRTPPGSVQKFIDTHAYIAEWFQQRTGDFGINPVVLSQHLHNSLIDPATGVNLLSEDTPMVEDILAKGIIDIYHRTIPLLRLPETVEGDTVYAMSHQVGNGVLPKGSDSLISGPLRIEGRMNSSEYATDPVLNLLIHLVGIDRALEFMNDHTELDKDYPLVDSEFPTGAYFLVGKGNYLDTVEHLLEDQVLADTLGSALVTTTHDIVESYPEISRGEISLSRARDRAYFIAEYLPEAQGLPKRETITVYDKSAT